MDDEQHRAMNGDDQVKEETEGKEEENGVVIKSEPGDAGERNDRDAVSNEPAELPIVIDDLAELGVEWLVTKRDEGVGNWGKEYETSECLENVDDGQLDIETFSSAMPNVKLSSHGQTMHLVPLKDDGITSTTLTWIRKTALRKDSASDRRITIRGLSLGDLFHPRIYTLIQLGHSMDYASTERTTANSCSSGILTLNFRTILDRLTALRRYLLDIEIPGRRLEIVCTFPDHKRPPEFDVLWKAYSIEGVPPCASQRPDRDILAKQVVVKNLPSGCDEDQIRKCFSCFCDVIEFAEDYNNQRCAIVTFVDIVTCHFAHARQLEITFEDGSRPLIYLMTDVVTNSKFMPRREKEETEDERHVRHTFELIWNHQQRVTNAMRLQERFGGRSSGNYQPRKGLQTIIRRLPNDVKQRVEDRALERQTKETAEKEKADAALAAAQQEALNDQAAPVKVELDANGSDKAETTPADGDPLAPTPQKRPPSSPAESQPLNKRSRRKNFRGGGAGIQRRGMNGNRRNQPQYYQRDESRGPPRASYRGGSPSPRPLIPPLSPVGRFGGGGGFMGESRANPWLVPPGAGALAFDRRMDAPGGYGGHSALLPLRDMPPPIERGGMGAIFGNPPYAGQGSGGYVGREGDGRHGGGGELYQRRDNLGPDYQRTDYRGFYGKR